MSIDSDHFIAICKPYNHCLNSMCLQEFAWLEYEYHCCMGHIEVSLLHGFLLTDGGSVHVPVNNLSIRGFHLYTFSLFIDYQDTC